MTSELRTAIPDREMSVYPEILQVKGKLSKRLVMGLAVALSITITCGLLLWDTGSFNYVSAIYNSHGLPQASTSNYIQNDKKAGPIDTVTIKTFEIDRYTLAKVDMPLKVPSGKQVNFILELSDTSSSTNSIVVTITSSGGQYVLFFPRSHVHKFVDKIQFQYAFPSPGTYNVDITFGGPAAANFNVNVANRESVA